MKTVDEILRGKGHEVWSVRPDDKVLDALRLMADKGIGSLVVKDGERLVGIFSERDYARKVVLAGKTSSDTPVREIMSSSVVTVSGKQSVQECMGIMTEHRIRHLPVMDKEKVAGVLSIGDLVKAVIEDQQFTIRELEKYVTS